MRIVKITFVLAIFFAMFSCEKEELTPVIPNKKNSEQSETKGIGLFPAEDPLTFTLQSSTNDTGPFASQEMTLFKNKVWLVGGDNSFTPPWTSSTQVWASHNGTDWKLITKGQFPERRNHSLLVYKDKLWVIGGIDNANNILSDIWNSSDGENWTRITSLNPLEDIGQNNSVVFNDRLFVFRGNGAENQEVWSSADGSNWRLETENAFPVRTHYKTVIFNDFIYVYGGWLRDGPSLTNEVWASKDGRYWYQKHPATTIFAPRIDHSATVYDGKVWVIGGNSWDASGRRTFHGDIWYSDNMKYWTKYDGKPPFYKGLHSHGALSYKNKLWIFGGYRPDASMSDIPTANIRSID